MRELSNHEKQEAITFKKQYEKMSSDLSNSSKDKERLQQEVNILNEQVIELKEQVGFTELLKNWLWLLLVHHLWEVTYSVWDTHKINWIY